MSSSLFSARALPGLLIVLVAWMLAGAGLAQASPPEPPAVAEFPQPPDLGGTETAFPALDIDPSSIETSLPSTRPVLSGSSGFNLRDVILTWTMEPPTGVAGLELDACLLQRRDSAGGWRSVHRAEGGATYQDTLPELNARYHYRVLPIYRIDNRRAPGRPSQIFRYYPKISPTLSLRYRRNETGGAGNPGFCWYAAYVDRDGECVDGRKFRTEKIDDVYNYGDENLDYGYYSGTESMVFSKHAFSKSGSEKTVDTYASGSCEIERSGNRTSSFHARGESPQANPLIWGGAKFNGESTRREDGTWTDYEGEVVQTGSEGHSESYPPSPDMWSPDANGWPTEYTVETTATTKTERWSCKIKQTNTNGNVTSTVDYTRTRTSTLSEEITPEEELDNLEMTEWEPEASGSNYLGCAHKDGVEQECEPTAWDIRELEYQWEFEEPVADTTVRWSISYSPDEDEGQPVAEPSVEYFEWKASGATTSPLYYIDRDAMSDDGSYCLRSLGISLGAADWRGAADEEEKDQLSFINHALGDEDQDLGEEPDPAGVTLWVNDQQVTTKAASFSLSVGGAAVDEDCESKLTWDETWIQVFGPHPETGVVEQLSSPAVYKGGRSASFTVKAADVPDRTAMSVVNLTVTDANGATIATDQIRLHVMRWPLPPQSPSFWDERIDFSDAVGARYRKVGLSGRPLSDSKPQAEDESDEPQEETYVDAFDLRLVHASSDIYIPIPGSELVLSARRSLQPEIWNQKSGLRPHERLDRPFGAGWSSNLVAYIEFTQPVGAAANGGENPTEARVHDESGRVHRFVMYSKNGATRWVPFVTAKNEARAYLNSLELKNGEWVFGQKYGNTLSFESAGSGSRLGKLVYASLPSDRLEGKGSGLTHYSYSRLKRVTDRLGYGLVYSYPGDYTLIPYRIHAVKADGVALPWQQIYIRQTGQKRITRIWDPRGNSIAFDYQERSGLMHPLTGQDQPVPVLMGVKVRDAADMLTGKTAYDYNGGLTVAQEPETLPRPDDVLPYPNLHVDLSSISDGRDNTWRFAYDFDHTKEIYVTSNEAEGFYPQNGLPRFIRSITPPGLARPTVFENRTRLRLEQEGIVDKLVGTRGARVIDAEGHPTTYSFLDNQVVTLTAFRDFYGRNNPGDKFFDPRLVYFTRMEVTHGTIGTETFTFLPEAGLALSSLKDLSGNVTRFHYELPLTRPAWLEDIYPPDAKLYTFWDDVTRQENAAGKIRSYTYSPHHRMMESITDEEGRLTFYDVDAKGRRTAERVFAQAGDKAAGLPPVSETLTAYDPVAPVSGLPGFVTTRTVKRRASDPVWTTDLVTTFTPDSRGRVATQTVYPVKDADGASVGPLATHYTYDLNNNRTSVTDPAGKITVFAYDGFNRLVRSTHHNWDFESRDHDLAGNLVRQRVGNGASILRDSEFRHDAWNRRTETEQVVATSPARHTVVTRVRYNAVGSVIERVDARGGRTVHTYDALQRLVATRDPEQNLTTYAYDLARNAGSSGFDSSGFKPTRVVDPRNYVTEYRYDSLYRLVETRAEFVRDKFAVTATVYDDVGNPELVTDPLGKRTRTVYDALNRPVTVIQADGTASSVTTTTSYTGTGLAWKAAFAGSGSAWPSADLVVRETETHYDGAGRPVRVLHPAVTTGQARAEEKTFYDAAGNIARAVDPRGHARDYHYDDRHRRTQEQLPAVLDALAGATSRPTTHTTYHPDGTMDTRTDAKGALTTLHHDGLGRPIRIVHPAGFGETSSTYDDNGNVLTATDPDGRVTTNTYDALNRLLTTTNAAGIKVENTYDAAGNRTAVIDGKGQKTRFDYDGFGRLTVETDPLGKAKTLVYDALNKTRRIDALGRVTIYEYDDLHRLRRILHSGTVAENRHLAYDAAGNLLSATHPNQDGATDTTYTYDARNRRLTETSAAVTHTYGYDLAGNRTSLSSAGAAAFVIEYRYDHAGRLSKVIEGGGTGPTTTYEYDLNGNAHRLLLPNGEKTVTTHDARDRVDTRRGYAPAASLPAYEFDSGYDLAGNLTTLAETYHDARLPNRQIVNAYDLACRLTSESISTSATASTPAKTVLTTYAYDKADNRVGKAVATTSGGTTATVFASSDYNALNQLTQLREGARYVDYAYDAAGNRVLRTARASLVATPVFTSYRYDRDDRLIEHAVGGQVHRVEFTPLDRPQQVTAASYQVGGEVHRYRYDHRTRRVSRLEPAAGGTTVGTRITFAGGVSVAEYAAGATSPEVRYVRGQDIGGGVGGMLYSLRGGAPLYSHYNARGDVVARTNAAGASTYAATYEAFGTTPETSGSNPDRFAANSKEKDPTGLLNEGFRYRDLETGTFLTRDPLGFVDGPNMYAYVVQNPWSKFDPLGLRTDSAGFKWTDKDHHKVPVEVAETYGWSKEAKKVFDDARIATPNGHNMTAHGRKTGYTGQVAAEMNDFLKAKLNTTDLSGVSARKQVEFAKEFVNQIDNTNNKFIKGFNSVVGKGADEVAKWFHSGGRQLARPLEQVGERLIPRIGRKLPLVRYAFLAATTAAAAQAKEYAESKGHGQVYSTLAGVNEFVNPLPVNQQDLDIAYQGFSDALDARSVSFRQDQALQSGIDNVDDYVNATTGR